MSPPSRRRATAGSLRGARSRSKAEGRGSRAEGLVEQLDAIEREGGDGTLRIARGKAFPVSNLDKVYFPDGRRTKGDVLRYYARVAPYILPVLKDRPLVLKRSPEGIKGKPFFQQNPTEHVPAGVRVEEVETETGPQERAVGGDLATLLYLAQLGCISMDPWHSRVQSLEDADYTVLDLDPGPRATFARVVEVALAVKEQLDDLGLHGAPKTSGSRGVHVVVPLPRGTSYETALVLAQLVATRVAEAGPRIATVERTVSARSAGAVYVDYLQNVRGKSIAAAYCLRAKPGATVSAPLDWTEVGDGLDPGDFTVDTMPARLAERGDLWDEGMRRRNTLGAIRAVVEGGSAAPRAGRSVRR